MLRKFGVVTTGRLQISARPRGIQINPYTKEINPKSTVIVFSIGVHKHIIEV